MSPWPAPVRSRIRTLLALGAAGAMLAGTGCGGGGPGVRRPVVTESAVEAAAKAGGADATGASRTLNFLDELENRQLVSHDDVLAAALLLGTGQSGIGFDDRVRAAVSLGYVDLGYNKPAREAATVGEVAQALVRVARGGRRVSVDEGLAEMTARGALPPAIKGFQGLTGAQLVSMLGAAYDAMSGMGVPRSSWPTSGAPPVERPAASAPESAAPPAQPPTSAGRPEPLPELTQPGTSQTPAPPAPQPSTAPYDSQGAIELGEPATVHASVPIQTPGAAPAVPTQAPVAPAKPASQWVAARPLKRD